MKNKDLGNKQLFQLPAGVVDVDLSQRPVLFHGVNKSGSLACATVLQRAYSAHGRQEDYMCRYFGIPDSIEAALATFAKKRELPARHALLIDHNLVGRSVEFPGAPYITLLRSPVRRMLSCYFWIKKHAPDQLRERDFSTWLEEAGLAYSLVFQFACFAGAGKDVKLDVQKLAPETVKQMAEDWFDENVVLFGIAEQFEESLFSLAGGLGLPSIPLWQPDKRNALRPPWERLSPDLIAYIEEVVAYDIDFYEERVRRLQPGFMRLNETPAFATYKRACSAMRQAQESSD